MEPGKLGQILSATRDLRPVARRSAPGGAGDRPGVGRVGGSGHHHRAVSASERRKTAAPFAAAPVFAAGRATPGTAPSAWPPLWKFSTRRPWCTTTSSTWRDTRRGRPSTNAQWGNHTCVLAGDWLYMQAFQIALRERNFHVLDLLIGLTQLMVEGELIQLERIGKIAITEADCMELVDRKTAGLFSRLRQAGRRSGGRG